MTDTRPVRMLLVKLGLDGHDRGIKVVMHIPARRRHGGHLHGAPCQSRGGHQNGLRRRMWTSSASSLLNNNHLSISRRLLDAMRKAEIADIPVVIGGIIPKEDEAPLKELGIAGVFPVHTPPAEIVDRVRSLVADYRSRKGALTRMTAPLEGIRVLDLSILLAGPFGTMILGDLGAEIIKIERPPKGDSSRHMPPHFVGGESAYYLSMNRNKKSITLDLKKPEGIEVFRDLVKQADVVWDNFRPGVMERLGIDYARVREINPKIISCSISGFGQSGPYRERPAFDLVVQAMGGVVSYTGEEDGTPVRMGLRSAIWAVESLARWAFWRRCRSAIAPAWVRWWTSPCWTCKSRCRSIGLSIIGWPARFPPPSERDTFPLCRSISSAPPITAWSSTPIPRKCSPGYAKALGRPEWITDPNFRDRMARWHNKKGAPVRDPEHPAHQDPRPVAGNPHRARSALRSGQLGGGHPERSPCVGASDDGHDPAPHRRRAQAPGQPDEISGARRASGAAASAAGATHERSLVGVARAERRSPAGVEGEGRHLTVCRGRRRPVLSDRRASPPSSSRRRHRAFRADRACRSVPPRAVAAARA